MLSRKVVKGKQDFFIFLQAFARFWEFALITGDELIVGCQSRLASWCQVHFMDQLLGFCLNALGHFIKDIGRLMHPATLLCDCSVFFLQSDPEAQRSVTNGQFGRGR